MLIRAEHLEGIRVGTIDLAFRRWKRPTVKSGGRLRTRIGELSIERVEPIGERSISARDAERAGFQTRAELLAELDRRPDGELYRVQLRLAGADPRIALRARSKLKAAEVALIRTRLDRFDSSSRKGPWTRQALDSIAARPGVRAPDLAAELGFETAWFKGNVRRLKELGLTESLDVGYRLSPRGKALHAALRDGPES